MSEMREGFFRISYGSTSAFIVREFVLDDSDECRAYLQAWARRVARREDEKRAAESPVSSH